MKPTPRSLAYVFSLVDARAAGARRLRRFRVARTRDVTEKPSLSTPFRKYNHVCGEGFLAQTGASDEHTLQRSVRSEQRSLGQKEPPPGGLRRFSVLALLLLDHSPTAGDAPSSRLARTENRRNKRGRIFGTGYLGNPAQ